ncbi:MAG TPA: GNAT family N-acetyltransferase [Edaphobacter sp.]|nr:GNAT family N-acetyltransferase [Edaphobacter sp.]
MSGEGFRIRVGRAADLTDVLEMERSIPEAPHWREAEYAAVIAADRSANGAVRRCLMVADTGSDLLGFAVGKVVCVAPNGVGELESVAVDPDARRRGVGRALCEAVVDWAKRLGAGMIELEVRATSDAAITLYEGLGFVFSGRRKGYYRTPIEDALLMKLELSRSNSDE